MDSHSCMQYQHAVIVQTALDPSNLQSYLSLPITPSLMEIMKFNNTIQGNQKYMAIFFQKLQCCFINFKM
jgi:hypothetical protein